jgi:2-methylcitrate dehydratase PrpD
MMSKAPSPGVTRALSAHLAEFRFEDLPPEAVHAARRGVLDWIGCALAGSAHPTIATLVSVLSEVSGKPLARVFGHALQLGLLEAPIANGQMGHILDYDDTHMGGVVLHASSPVLAALFALTDRSGASGKDFIAAYAAGFEAGVRTGQASPRHHDGGWHLTGTLGTLAAGAACAKVLGLSEKQMTHALGIAATQAAGMQQNRGTMCKSFHAGKAASNGVLAALLAQQGFDSSEEIIEGRKGYCRIYSSEARPHAAIEALGTRWEIARNGHKPYACGVVLHPVIDAMLELRAKSACAPEAVSAIELTVHPHVISITGVEEPKTGLQSKFSVYHSAAVAFIDGDAGIAQYTDERAREARVVALRGKVRVTTDDTLRKDEARAIVSAHGTCCEAHVPHASGTVDNPMSDSHLERKFRGNAEPILGRTATEQVIETAWKLDRLTDVRELSVLLATPRR